MNDYEYKGGNSDPTGRGATFFLIILFFVCCLWKKTWQSWNKVLYYRYNTVEKLIIDGNYLKVTTHTLTL